MPLLCQLGRHRPGTRARWNDGYYFARCTRCHRDLVRTAFEGWHVPRGYRVVWQAKPPQGAGPAGMLRERRALAQAPETVAADIAAVGAAETDFLPAEPDRAPPEERAVQSAPPEADHAGDRPDEEAPEPRTAHDLAAVDQAEGMDQAPTEAPVEAERRPPPPSGNELPIQEVLRHLNSEALPLEPLTAFAGPLGAADPDADALTPEAPAEAPDNVPAEAPAEAATGENVGSDREPGEQPSQNHDMAATEEAAFRESPGPDDGSAGDGEAAGSAAEAEVPEAPGSAAEAEVPEAPRSASGGGEDFMNDENDTLPWNGGDALAGDQDFGSDEPSGSRSEPPAAPLPLPDAAAYAGLSAAPAFGGMQIPPMTTGEAAGARWSDAEDQEDGSRRGSTLSGLQIAVVAAVLLALLLIAATLLSGLAGNSAADTDPMAEAPPAGPQPVAGTAAFVAASLLNCRAAPARQARSVRVLARGEPVRILEREEGWASLAHQGGQCWAQARYLTVEQPI